MNKQEAEKLNEYIEKIIQNANHVLYIANNSDDDALKQCVQKTLGMIVAELDLKLLEPIYKKFPVLRPKNL